MLHWNAPPLHLADLFIKHSLDDHFSNKKDKHWLFYKKSEQYQTWKITLQNYQLLPRVDKRAEIFRVNS